MAALPYEKKLDEAVTAAEKDKKTLTDERAKVEAQIAEIDSRIDTINQFIARATGRTFATNARRGRRSGSGGATRTRTTMSEGDRESAALQFIAGNREGVTAKAVADHLGVSPATATKTVNTLLESGRIVSEGERRARRLRTA